MCAADNLGKKRLHNKTHSRFVYNWPATILIWMAVSPRRDARELKSNPQDHPNTCLQLSSDDETHRTHI
jgi:hypothetical protein